MFQILNKLIEDTFPGQNTKFEYFEKDLSSGYQSFAGWWNGDMEFVQVCKVRRKFLFPMRRKIICFGDLFEKWRNGLILISSSWSKLKDWFQFIWRGYGKENVYLSKHLKLILLKSSKTLGRRFEKGEWEELTEKGELWEVPSFNVNDGI